MEVRVVRLLVRPRRTRVHTRTLNSIHLIHRWTEEVHTMDKIQRCFSVLPRFSKGQGVNLKKGIISVACGAKKGSNDCR